MPLLVGALAGLAGWAWQASAHAFENNIGFGAALYADTSERTNDTEPSIGNQQELDGSFDYEADSSLNLQLWYLRSPTPQGSFRWLYGGGVAFFNEYTVVEVLEDDNGEDPEKEQYGNMFQIYLEGDMAIPLSKGKALDLLVGARLGGLLLFQSRDLEEELETLSDQGVSVWPSAPRAGATLGPHVGLLWGFSERVGLRFDAGVQFAYLHLFSGESDVGGTIERTASLTTTRFQGLLGLHVGF
jgi:hypothetical protein